MKQIIKNNRIDYEMLNIYEDTRVLDYLRRDTSYSFLLQYVPEEIFQKLQITEDLLHLYDYPYIAGYCSGGSGQRELASENKDIRGTFKIDEEKIIYTPEYKFSEIRDFYIYRGVEYYTTMTMPEILEEELTIDRKFFIDMGQELRDYTPFPVFEEVSRSEMMEYAVNPDKGKIAYEKRIKIFR